MKISSYVIVFLVFVYFVSSSFISIPLGVAGGNYEGQLNSFLIGVKDKNGLVESFLAMDAGNIIQGLISNYENLNMKIYAANEGLGGFLKNKIKAYCITHPHLDHLSGLIINSVDDLKLKPIYGLNFTISAIENHLFNWVIWPNFATQGPGFPLGTYNYVVMNETDPVSTLDNKFNITAYTLSHSNPYQSTAFLVEHSGKYILFLGDTGPDAVEKQGKLKRLWTNIAPLVANGLIEAIFIECSFDNSKPDSQLFGHMTPKWIINELNVLAEQVSNITQKPTSNSIANTKIIIMHIKPVLDLYPKSISAQIDVIKSELDSANNISVKFIFPTQGKIIDLEKSLSTQHSCGFILIVFLLFLAFVFF